MLPAVITIALSVDLLLVCLSGCIPYLSKLLPIGGSHLAQVGFLLGVSVALAHLWEVHLAYTLIPPMRAETSSLLDQHHRESADSKRQYQGYSAK
jgi:hypothetical protein